MASHHGADALRLDHVLGDAHLHGRQLGLTPREFLLLAALAEQPHHLVTYEQLVQNMWGSMSVDDRHAIEVYVSRLRRKLGETGVNAQIIQTVRGRGYMYVPPDPAPQAVRLVYDRNLTLREMEPDDRPFLGWNPAEVLDTFFLLTTFSLIHSNQRAALNLVRLLAAVGFTTWESPMAVRAADESTHVAMVTMELHARARRFLGMNAFVRL